MTLSDDPDSAATIDYAIRHHSVISFGRFPHRNQILSRATTLEEAEFLKTRFLFLRGQGKVRIVERGAVHQWVTVGRSTLTPYFELLDWGGLVCGRFLQRGLNARYF